MFELSPESSPNVQALIAESRDREEQAVSIREIRAEVIVGGLFMIVAASIAIGFDSDRELEAGAAIAVFLTLVAASRMAFEVGSVYTAPTMVAFVPALFLLPVEVVPLFVAAALALGKLFDVHRGRSPGRAFMALGDAWYTVGPVLVILAAGSPAASAVAPLTLLLALLAQFLGEGLSSRLREWLHAGASLREQLLESAWIYTADALFAAVGFGLALAAEQSSGAVLLALPLFAVLAFLARDRTEKLSSVLELSEAYRGTARLLSNVVGYDDAYTGDHSHGVTDLAGRVAERMRLTDAQRRKVEFGAMLHDIGKIAISKEIINKPNSLSEEEWALVRTHTIEGQKMLDQIGGLMSEIGTIVRWCHERYDGAGYPDGLSREEIPVEARIVFVCDAFNAMTTDRPYRAAMREHVAIGELRANAGTQFDPIVVDALVHCLDELAGRTS